MWKPEVIGSVMGFVESGAIHLCAESISHCGYCDYQTSKAIFTKNIKQVGLFGK